MYRESIFTKKIFPGSPKTEDSLCPDFRSLEKLQREDIFMGFWEALGGAIARGGMDEKTYERYQKMNNSELVRRARQGDVNALKTLKLKIKDDEEIKQMLKRGY